MNKYYKLTKDFRKTYNSSKPNDRVSSLTETPILQRPILRFGDQGDYVNLLQAQLKQLLFYSGSIDGNFNNKTLSSVRDFQNNNNLTVDGIVGRDTWSALIDLYQDPFICEGDIHIVKPGESLWGIAKRYNTTVEELMTVNNLTTTLLSVGQYLIIPAEPIPPTEPIEQTIYIVQSGDSLWSISRRFKVTVQQIRDANNLTTDLLSIGQRLVIPIGTQEQTIYIVQSGDSLWSISRKFGVTVQQIRDANNLTTDLLSIGQRLIIPGTQDQTIYIVQSGDSLWSISRKFGVTVQQIRDANNLTTDLLSIGQRLIIPQ